MPSAIIIDDEEKLRKVLEIKLNQLCPEISIVGMAQNASEAYQLITALAPDMIFLDISMPLETGFEMLKRFEEINFEIIFVTGYDEYALDALKVSAIDYLLKPVKGEELVRAVDKVKDRLEHKDKMQKYEILKHNIDNVGSQNSRIAIPGRKSYEFVPVGDIIRCEGWQKYTKIYLSDGEVIVSSYNLGVFREMLNNYNFFLTHKSHLINNSNILRYLKEGIVVMNDNSEVPVSRRKREEFIANLSL